MSDLVIQVDAELDVRPEVPATTRRLFQDLALELAVLDEDEALELVLDGYAALNLKE